MFATQSREKSVTEEESGGRKRGLKGATPMRTLITKSYKEKARAN